MKKIRHYFARLSVIVSMLLAQAFCALQVGSAVAKDTAPIIRPTERVANASQGEWSVRWWQWAASFDYNASPVADRTGDRCANGQSGPVWFLAGVYGSEPVRRHCRVPSDKYLFFPIVNSMVNSNPSDAFSCASVTQSVKEEMDGISDLAVIIDGVEVNDLVRYRQTSPNCFNLGTRAQEYIFPAAANGYFVMLAPLTKGRHTIKWGGIAGSFRQAVIYELVVGD